MKLFVFNLLRPIWHAVVRRYDEHQERTAFRKTRQRLVKEYKKAFAEKDRGNSKTVYLVLTPEHTNLGDHAIALAEIELLKEYHIEYVEITGDQLAVLQEYRCLDLMDGKPILINGGGNLGTLWFEVEKLMREIVLCNPNSEIFILPNTIYYEDTDFGRTEFEKSKYIYNAHTKLHIYAREMVSYEKMRCIYNSVKLVPDMVLSMNWSQERLHRSGCILCLRNDKEGLYADEVKNRLFSIMQTMFGEDICFSDMHSMQKPPFIERERALAEKRREFQSAQLVITDRLHGMILCAITGTPCVVIDSRSPKVKGCYKWIDNLPYIKFCDSINDVLLAAQSIPQKDYYYDNREILHYYNELMDDIVEAISLSNYPNNFSADN